MAPYPHTQTAPNPNPDPSLTRSRTRTDLAVVEGGHELDARSLGLHEPARLHVNQLVAHLNLSADPDFCRRQCVRRVTRQLARRQPPPLGGSRSLWEGRFLRFLWGLACGQVWRWCRTFAGVGCFNGWWRTAARHCRMWRTRSGGVFVGSGAGCFKAGTHRAAARPCHS